jgi:DNA primase
MHKLSNSTGPDSSSETSGDNRSVEAVASAKQFYKELIAKANSVSIKSLFKIYGVRVDEHNKKANCPFPSHNDKTPSFLYYPETNSFYCHGCKAGTRPVDFIVHMEGLARARAAARVMELCGQDADADNEFESIDYGERLEIIMEFSNFVREFIQANSENEVAITYIEKVTAIFDQMNSKHKLDNSTMKNLTAKLIAKGSLYKPCPTL